MRHAGDGDDLVGHVPRAGLLRIAFLRPVAELVGELLARRQLHEQRHPVAAVGLLHPEDDAVGDLGDRLDRRVDVGVPIRTPPRLSVESERPVMMQVPRSVISSQSPCRQTPGHGSKYASR